MPFIYCIPKPKVIYQKQLKKIISLDMLYFLYVKEHTCTSPRNLV